MKRGNEEGEMEVTSYSLTSVPALLLYNSRMCTNVHTLACTYVPFADPYIHVLTL